MEPDWLVQARKRVEAANAEYDAHVESVLSGNGTPWEPRREELVQICVQAERELRECQRVWGEELAQRDYRDTLESVRP